MRQGEKEWRKRKKKEHAVIFDAVRGVIHQWDPYGLLALGCPVNEFDAEIQAVVRQIDRIGSPQDAVHVLSRVFSSYFEPERFRLEDCRVVGEQLYQVLQEGGILPDSKGATATGIGLLRVDELTSSTVRPFSFAIQQRLRDT